MHEFDVPSLPVASEVIANLPGHGGPVGIPPTAGRGNAKTQITHDTIIDLLLAHPGMTNKQIANELGWKSQQAISIILNSDAFQARLHARRTEIIDPLLKVTIEDKIRNLAAVSAEKLAEKLESSEDANFMLKVFSESTKAAGYGAAKNAPVVQTNFVVALPGPAGSSQAWMERFGQQTVQVVAPTDVSSLPEEPSGG